MNKLPPFLRNKDRSLCSICLILEGYEEWYYFERLKNLNVFSSKYNLKLINAKSASSVPAKYQEALNSNSYEIVLIVCDRDRIPTEYDNIVLKVNTILGNKKSESLITYIRPCTLQIILLHFGDVVLETQAKKASRDAVFNLTKVENYDAHNEQLDEICNKIYKRTWVEMIRRLDQISDNPAEIPSSNIKTLFCHLENDDKSWITELNNIILPEI